MQKETTRKCIVTGQILDKSALLRFTTLPDNTVVPDFKKKLPNKGFYLTNSKSLLEKAINNNIFAKSLKFKAKVNLTLVDQVFCLLHKQALNSISLARKAGIMVSGMDKVKEALKKNSVAFLLEASNAGNDGHSKILSMAQNIEIFNLFTIEELDRELAKENTVHIAFIKGKMANTVKDSFKRLASFINN